MTMPSEFEDQPPQYPAYQPPQYPASKPAAGNGLSIAALVVGIVSLFTSLCNIFGLPFPIAAIVLGILGRQRGGGGMATAGLILGIVGLLLNLAIIAFSLWFVSSGAFEEFQQQQMEQLEQMQQQQQLQPPQPMPPPPQ